MTQRRGAIALVLVGLLATSGCLGFITGSNALAFEADDVTVTQQARSDAGYSEARHEAFTNTQEFTVAGQTREVKVTNHIAEYERTVSLPVLGEQPLARFSVISSPGVEIAGQTLNPLGKFSDRELAMQFQEKYDTVSDVRFVDNRTVEVQGGQETVSKFTATATLESGQEADVYLHIAKYKDGDDFIVAVAVYPQNLDGEQSNVDTLLSGIEHPA
jgi:hypothetical protein